MAPFDEGELRDRTTELLKSVGQSLRARPRFQALLDKNE